MSFVMLPVAVFSVVLLVGGLALIADAAVRAVRGR
jgi:hypothetical protein